MLDLVFILQVPFRMEKKMIGMRQRWTQKDQSKFSEKMVALRNTNISLRSSQRRLVMS